MHQRLDIGDMRQRQNTTAINVLILRHVARNYRQAHIDPTQKGLDFQHFGDQSRSGDKFVECARLGFIKRHPQADFDGIAQCGPVDHRLLPKYNPGGLHLFQPSPTCSRGQVTTIRQLVCRQVWLRLILA